MTTINYNAAITFDSRDHEHLADLVVDTLLDFHVAAGADPLGNVTALITLPAEGLPQATAMALALAASIPARALGIEVLPTDIFDTLAGLTPAPELLSVTQAAETLGVSRQAVLERLNRGTLAGVKIGTRWNVYASSVEGLRAV